MIKKVKVRVNEISMILCVFLMISCKNESKKIVVYNDFDSQKLKPISKSESQSNWYLKGIYSNDSLKSLIFLTRKKDSILKKDSVFYVNNFRYFVDDSEIKVNSSSLHLIKIAFVNNNKIQRHILFRREKNYYLLAIERQTKPFEFELKRINTNSYCLKFKNINEYLKNIKISENELYYFTDFISYELFYKNNKLFYKETGHFEWGNANSTNFSTISNVYKNVYLDLNNFKKPNYFLDSSSFMCLK